MLKNHVFAWTITAIVSIIAIVSVSLGYKSTRNANDIQSQLDALQRLVRSDTEYETARFVSVDMATRTITFETPHQMEIDGEIFVNYTRQDIVYDPTRLLIISTIEDFSASQLHELEAGQPIEVRIVDQPDRRFIEALIIL